MITGPCEKHSEAGVMPIPCPLCRVAGLENALRDALGGFTCTQRVLSYPESHWSRRACALLGESAEQPDYIAFTRP